MQEKDQTLSQMLRFFREKKKMTQEQVAQKLMISRAHYANFETGRTVPSFENVLLLSKILDHDFTFAYVITTRKRPAQLADMICEEGAKYNVNRLTNEASFDTISKRERSLLETYISLRKLRGNNNELQKYKQSN